MSDFRQDYNPPSRYPGADSHTEPSPQDLPMVGAPPGGQWHNSEGLEREQG